MFKTSFISFILSLFFFINAANSANFTVREVNNDLSLLIISGHINSNDYDKYILAYKSKNNIKQVWLNSPGGSLTESIKIAMHVHNSNLMTVVPPSDFDGFVQCNSGCAIISLAGKIKIMTKNSIIGLHSAYIEKSKKRIVDKDVIAANAFVNHMFGQFGLPPEISIIWTTTSPYTMTRITPELNDLHEIGYRVVDVDYFK